MDLENKKMMEIEIMKNEKNKRYGGSHGNGEAEIRLRRIGWNLFGPSPYYKSFV